MPRVLVALLLLLSLVACEDVRGERVYWTSVLDDAQITELKKTAPNVRFVKCSRKEALERATEFHGADAHLLSEEFLAAAKNLRWVQSWSAGVDRYMGLKGLIENDAITFTNMKGAHGPVIAEHVFAMLLALRRDLPAYFDAQREGRWDRRAGSGQRALAGSTLLVAGMGGIGREIAKRGKGFDMKVLATVRNAREAPEFVDELGTSKVLDRFLERADVVAIALPLTKETTGLFNAERIAKMKKGAILLNIGRGKIVDTEALVAALKSGHLAGAGLDVTDPEPLPEDSPLWKMKNVIITPHVAGRAELTRTRRTAIFRRNVERFAKGRKLVNVVDKKAGY